MKAAQQSLSGQASCKVAEKKQLEEQISEMKEVRTCIAAVMPQYFLRAVRCEQHVEAFTYSNAAAAGC